MTVQADARYDGAAAPTVTTGAGAAALLFAGLAGFRLLLPPGGAGHYRVAAACVSAGVALALGALSVVSASGRLPQRLAQQALLGGVVLAAADAVTRMVLGRSPADSVWVMLALVAAGAALVSVRWLVLALYLVWGGWIGAAFAIGPSRQWVYAAAGMLVASGIAAVVNHGRRRLLDALLIAQDLAEAAAVRDHLTGLANRRGLAMLGTQILETSRRQGDAVHCVFIDVDSLKKVNSSLGHECGDDVLVAVADALRSVTRATDVVARWGGDEFCVVGPGPGIAPLELERRVRDKLLAAPPVDPAAWDPRISAGGAMLAPWDSGSLDTLLGKADQEMHLRRALRRETATPASRRVDLPD